MMKLIFLTCLSMLFFVSCNTDTNSKVHQDFHLTVQPELNIENPKVVAAVKEYIASNSDNPSRVYTMMVSRKNLLTTSFQLSAIATYKEFNELIPFGYFTVDDDLVLVYSGLEHLRTKDEVFFNELRNEIGDRLENDPGLIFDPSTWEVTMTGDSVTIERGVMNLLGPPVVEVIKFTPPTKK